MERQRSAEKKPRGVRRDERPEAGLEGGWDGPRGRAVAAAGTPAWASLDVRLWALREWPRA